jgi:hypothetical protein
VQSKFEPGENYFVSQMPHMANRAYPEWDQRYFLPPGEILQGPYAALSSGFARLTGIDFGDTLFALRLDSGQTAAFPFRDSGYGWKVAECGYEAFAAVGGVVAQQVNNSVNDFLLLYLAFPGKLTPQAVLTQFGTATNAEDFPSILAFLAQATMDAKGHSKRVGGDPLDSYEKWKKRGTPTRPAIYDTIVTALSNNGFNPAGQKYLQRHPDAVGGRGPYLTGP